MIMLAQPMRRVGQRNSSALPRVRYNQILGTPISRLAGQLKVAGNYTPIGRLAFPGPVDAREGDHRDFRREQRTQKTRTAAPQRRPIAARAIADSEVAGAA